jgi:hypothetical protein
MSTFSTILHKRNSTAGAIPSPSSLSAGEIAINTFDGKIFAKATDSSIKSFLNEEQLPHTLDQSLSSVNYQYGNNTVSGIFASVLNGMSNDISGAGSSVINGSDNDITADYALIGNGASNKIFDDGDYGAILGGQNNNLNHQESFIIGSNITSHLSGFTYVNNLSVLGKVYGDGLELTGINRDTEVRSLTANWESTYTTFSTASSTFLTSETDSQTLSFNEGTKDLTISNGNTVSLSALVDAGSQSADTEVRSLTANWEDTYTTVQTNSASWGGGGSSDIIDLTFKTAYTTYYHELQYDSVTTNLSAVQIYEDNTKTTHLFEKLLTRTTSALLTGISITDKVNNNTLTKTLSYDGSDNLISTTRIYT